MLAETIPGMLRRAAQRWPDRVFVRWSDRGRTITFAEADASTDRVAAGLGSLGVEPGDRVGIAAHAGLDYMTASFGAWKAGAISAHISVQLAADLGGFVRACTPKVLIYTHDLFDALERDRAAMPSIRHYVCMDGPQPGAMGWDDLVGASGPPPTAPRPAAVDPDMPCHLSFTSGSTGRPKAAVLRHGSTARATACIAERLGLTGADVSLGPTSPASSYGLVANWLPGLHVGMTIGLRSRWDAAACYDDMVAHGVTYLPANPIVLDDLLQESRRRGGPPAPLRLVVSGGAPVAPELKRAYFDELGVPFAESYGQSELGGFVALARPTRPSDDRLGAVGPALPDKIVAVVDDLGRELGPGEPGELCISGGYMWGYWGEPEKTAEAVRDGWLHTGDVGVMDADGHISTLGRWSERIDTPAGTIYPRPIEERLQHDARVRFAAVIPAPGAVPIAVVELRDTMHATAEEVLATYLQGGGDPRLDRVVVVDHIPQTPTGKLDKIALRARFG